MKISERLHDDDGGKVVIQQTFDPNYALKQAKVFRDMELGHTGEWRHAGRVPGWMIHEWCKEAGVSPTDSHAMQEVIRKKLQSGEFSALRNWGGTF